MLFCGGSKGRPRVKCNHIRRSRMPQSNNCVGIFEEFVECRAESDQHDAWQKANHHGNHSLDRQSHGKLHGPFTASLPQVVRLLSQYICDAGPHLLRLHQRQMKIVTDGISRRLATARNIRFASVLTTVPLVAPKTQRLAVASPTGT